MKEKKASVLLLDPVHKTEDRRYGMQHINEEIEIIKKKASVLFLDPANEFLDPAHKTEDRRYGMQHTNEEIKIIKKNGSGATLRSSTLKTKVEILDEGYEAKSRKKVILKTCSFVILFLTFMVSSWVSPNSSVSVFITASSSLGLIVCFWFWVIPGVRRANAKTNLINLKGATRILEIEFEERICGNVKISYADSRGTLSEIIQPFQVVENIEKEGIEIDWTNKTITIPWLK